MKSRRISCSNPARLGSRESERESESEGEGEGEGNSPKQPIKERCSSFPWYQARQDESIGASQAWLTAQSHTISRGEKDESRI